LFLELNTAAFVLRLVEGSYNNKGATKGRPLAINLVPDLTTEA